MESTKPKSLCQLDGCFTHVKNKRRKYCSKECHSKSKEAKIPTCYNPDCNNKVKRGRNHYCSWECYKIVNNKNAHTTCQREGCSNPFTSRKSTRKYCSQACYKLDAPNRPSQKKVRICTLPECNNPIKRRGSGRKYCSVACTVKSRKKITISNCPNCNEEFEPKRIKQIFCSDKCRKVPVTNSIKKINGIPRRFTKVDKKWILTANITWKETNGEIPSGKQVWFKDGECLNDMDINNLYLVDDKEYKELLQKVTHFRYESRISNISEEQPKESEYFDHNQSFF